MSWFKVGDALRIGIQRVALNERARSDEGRTHRTVEGWQAIDHATPAMMTVVFPVCDPKHRTQSVISGVLKHSIGSRMYSRPMIENGPGVCV